jgi:hypothetical protein
MDRPWSTTNLTKIEGCPDRASLKAGMAFFANTGPAGTTCGSCSHLGETGAKKGNPRCAKFRELAGRRGEVINKNNPSCKYFEARRRP